jgi:hypothetical protein
MASHIGRRKFLATLGGAAAAWPLTTPAQQAAVPVIGFLAASAVQANAAQLAAFRRGLNGAGFVEGRDVAIESADRRAGRRGALLAVMAGLAVSPVPVVTFAPPAAAAPLAQFLISPTALDFGDVPLGSTSPQQTITITNKGSLPVVMSGAGGGAGVFGGVQDCQGTTLAPGASCHMFYAFTPTTTGAVTGTTSGSWNGQAFNLTFKGNATNR